MLCRSGFSIVVGLSSCIGETSSLDSPLPTPERPKRSGAQVFPAECLIAAVPLLGQMSMPGKSASLFVGVFVNLVTCACSLVCPIRSTTCWYIRYGVARAFSMTSWPTGDESSMLMLAMINGNGTGDDEEYDDNDDVDDAALNDETLRKTMMG